MLVRSTYNEGGLSSDFVKNIMVSTPKKLDAKKCSPCLKNCLLQRIEKRIEEFLNEDQLILRRLREQGKQIFH